MKVVSVPQGVQWTVTYHMCHNVYLLADKVVTLSITMKTSYRLELFSLWCMILDLLALRLELAQPVLCCHVPLGLSKCCRLGLKKNYIMYVTARAITVYRIMKQKVRENSGEEIQENSSVNMTEENKKFFTLGRASILILKIILKSTCWTSCPFI